MPPQDGAPPGPSCMKTRVYIVDDHSLVRLGLASLISAEPDLELCGQAESSRTALSQIVKLQPHVAIVDISLDGHSGLELIKSLRCFNEEIKIVVLSMHHESIYALRTLKAGARGYVMKSDGATRVIEAIRHVRNGHIFVSDDVSAQLWTKLVNGEPDEEAPTISVLTDRELEIVTMIGNGFSSREIATRLRISAKTVETHRAHIKAKLNLVSAPQLIRFCLSWAEKGDVSAARSAANQPASD
jgi:DNA-binding NarL/FixJ family response regulator